MNVEGQYYDIELEKVVSDKFNFVASAYGRNIKTLLEYATNNNEILYFDKSQIKKVSQLFNTHGLQLPAPLKTTNFSNSISNSETNVNRTATESLKNTENTQNIDENSNIADWKPKTQYAIKNVDKTSHDLQRFYLHEISLNKKEVNPFKTVAATGQTNSLHGGLTSNNSISNSETNVNSIAKESLKNTENTQNIDENSNIADWKPKIQYAIKNVDKTSHDLQRFYLHEISLNKKEVNPFKTATAAGQASSKRSGLTSNNSISNSNTNVNSIAKESLENDEKASNIDENSNIADWKLKIQYAIKNVDKTSHDLQRFYLHEISLNKKEVNPFKTAAAAGRTNSERSGLTSTKSISNSNTNVNN